MVVAVRAASANGAKMYTYSVPLNNVHESVSFGILHSFSINSHLEMLMKQFSIRLTNFREILLH